MSTFTTGCQGLGWNDPFEIVSSARGDGLTSRLFEVNGRAGICYDHELSSLWYVRGLDTTGTSWSEPLVVDSEPFSGYRRGEAEGSEAAGIEAEAASSATGQTSPSTAGQG